VWPFLAVLTITVALGVGAVVWATSGKPHPSRAVTLRAHAGVPPSSRATVATRPPSHKARAAAALTVITPSQAARVVHDYWDVHEAALVEHNLPRLAHLSAGAARDWEQPAVACGCLSVSSPRPFLNAAYFVPRQRRYPASFIAEVQTEVAGTYWAELLVFTKSRSGGPWLVTEDSGFGPPAGVAPRLGAPVADSAGYDRPVSGSERARARTVAGRFAALWQQAKNTGTVPAGSGFDLTGQTGARVARLAAFTQDAVQMNGLIGHYTFYTSRTDPLIQVTDVDGYDLACQSIRETVVYTPTPGHLIAQDPLQHNWGPYLSPGSYRKVIDRDTWQTCFLLAPDAGTSIRVLDQDVGGGASSGVR